MWIEYDPAWLIEAASYRFDKYPWLRSALFQCTKAHKESDYYIYFIEKSLPNELGSEWQFQESIIIENTSEGEVVIDIVKPNRIGGVEFLSKLLAN